MMAFICVSGEAACRHEELARMAAQRLGCELITEARLVDMIASEFGARNGIPDKAWPHLATSILAKLGSEEHLVISSIGSELLFQNMPGVLRAHVVAPEARRLGNLMVDRSLERQEAKEMLRRLEREQAATLKRRFGRAGSRTQSLDLVMNANALTIEQMADVLESAVKAKGMLESGVLSQAAEIQVQFQVRLKLARYGIVPPDRVTVKNKEFGHPSEEVFANLLDFYRIAWDYEPRSFPLQWDKDGKVLEAFTPDFYLPEFDLYVELTTMKQVHVTKKNRKIRLLRAIYPHVNIQVFYQKDIQDLVIKYGLPERLAR
jgi:cytidylate kinase